MSELPRRRKRKRFGTRAGDGPIRLPQYLQWLRKNFGCAAGNDGNCAGRMEACHLRKGTDGGMGQKPSDCWALPMCEAHHRTQHSLGEETFWRQVGYPGIPLDVARAMFSKWQYETEAGKKYRARQNEE